MERDAMASRTSKPFAIGSQPPLPLPHSLNKLDDSIARPEWVALAMAEEELLTLIHVVSHLSLRPSPNS